MLVILFPRESGVGVSVVSTCILLCDRREKTALLTG